MGYYIPQLKESFNINFEKKGSEEYLVLTCAISQAIREYQIEMINNNNHPGILKIEKCLSDKKVRLLYNVTSKLSLSKYLQINDYNASTIVKIYNYIASIFSECGNYFLKPSGFLIHEDYIFIDADTGQVKMVYMPIIVAGDAIENAKDMFRRISIEKKLKPQTYEKEANTCAGDYPDLDFCRYPKALQHREPKPYILDEGPVRDKTLGNEIKIFSLIVKKQELYIYLACQLVVALIIALAAPHLRFAVGNIMTYIGMILIIGAVDVFIIKRVFTDKAKDYDDSLTLQGKEELTYRD